MPEELTPLPENQLVTIESVQRRTDDFEDLYANNVYLEGNAWELQMTFGQLRHAADGNTAIEQHTRVDTVVSC